MKDETKKSSTNQLHEFVTSPPLFKCHQGTWCIGVNLPALILSINESS